MYGHLVMKLLLIFELIDQMLRWKAETQLIKLIVHNRNELRFCHPLCVETHHIWPKLIGLWILFGHFWIFGRITKGGILCPVILCENITDIWGIWLGTSLEKNSDIFSGTINFFLTSVQGWVHQLRILEEVGFL